MTKKSLGIASLAACLLPMLFIGGDQLHPNEKDKPWQVQCIKIKHGEDKFVKAALSRDGKLLAVSNEKQVCVFQLNKEKASELLSFDSLNCWCLAFSSDQLFLAAGGDDIVIFDLVKRQVSARFKGDFRRVNSLAFSQDGQTLLSGDMSGNVTTWNLRNRKEEAKVAALKRQVRAIAVRKNMVAIGVFGGPAMVWEIDKRREIKSFGNRLNVSQSLAFSPDGTSLAIAFTEFNSGVVDPTLLETPNRIKVFTTPNWTVKVDLKGHEGQITSIGFSPDGKMLASGGWDKKIKIWDLVSATLKYEWNGHGKPITTVIWMPGGHEIISSGLDGSVKIWRVPKE